MRQLLFALSVDVVAIGFVTQAKAQNYPWCAVYEKGAAAQKCGFVGFDQCHGHGTGHRRLLQAERAARTRKITTARTKNEYRRDL
jgi:Protein of unknown function (DUF3551)